VKFFCLEGRDKLLQSNAQADQPYNGQFYSFLLTLLITVQDLPKCRHILTICVHICISIIFSPSLFLSLSRSHTHTYTYTNTNTHIERDTHMYIYIHTHTHKNVCIICMSVCVFECIKIYKLVHYTLHCSWHIAADT